MNNIEILPRCIDRSQAAKYCGLSVSGFSAWVAKGIVPGPIPGTRQWDRKAIEAALDKRSRIERESEPLSAYDEWKASLNARKA